MFSTFVGEVKVACFLKFLHLNQILSLLQTPSMVFALSILLTRAISHCVHPDDFHLSAMHCMLIFLSSLPDLCLILPLLVCFCSDVVRFKNLEISYLDTFLPNFLLI